MSTIFRPLLLAILIAVNAVSYSFGQTNFTQDEYKKALWITTRFYGAQRSGEGPNWLVAKHNVTSTTALTDAGADFNMLKKGQSFMTDADGSYDLTGGWYDCGDHAMFGQTQFYAAYALLLGYAEFPEGYDDYYSFDYNGYLSADEYTWEGKNGAPNGIPDILDEVKYATDFFIKCARNDKIFYFQKGDVTDHSYWVTSVAMSILDNSYGGGNGGSRLIGKIDLNAGQNGAAGMASLCGATLALMSNVYRKFDPEYADLCLTHAKHAQQFVSGQSSPSTSGALTCCYSEAPTWEEKYFILLAELYRATGDNAYKTEALAHKSGVHNHYHSLCYNNCDDFGAYLLGTMGDSDGNSILETLTNSYIAESSNNILQKGPSWGTLRYTAAQAFSIALYDKLNNVSTVNKYSLATIDYILGHNSSNFSFVVGFGANSVQHPHHRNIYLDDSNPQDKNSLTISPKHKQFGYMSGGMLDPASYDDNANKYNEQEGGIDYNAGLVATLGYINAMAAPIDTNKFGHPVPELGEEKTLCGTGSATLNIGISPIANVDIQWFKNNNGSSIEVAGSSNKSAITVTEAGTYICQFDSAGEWQTSAKVIVSDVLPTVDLGTDIVLCNPATATISTSVNGDGISYNWEKDGTPINETGQSIEVYTAGEYTLTVSALGCQDQTDAVTVTSMLPEVTYDTICQAGTVTLKVNDPGSYEWFDQPEDGTSLSTSNPFTTTVSDNSIFYVQDANSFAGSVGPDVALSSGSDWGINKTNHVAFTVERDFQITSMKIMLGNIYGDDNAATISIEILDASGNSFSPAQTFTSDGIQITTSMKNTMAEFPFSNLNIKKSWGTELRMKLSAISYNGGIMFDQSGASYPYESSPSGVVTITGAKQDGNDAPNAYMYFYDWQIIAGSSCARTPVLAVVDPNAPNCGQSNTLTQSIVIKSGWNLVGIGVSLADYSIETLFGSNISNVEVIKNNEGYYMPNRASYFNSISEMTPGKAYLVKASGTFTFEQTGTELTNLSRSLSAGWNLISFPYGTATSTETATNSIGTTFESIKDLDQFYIKNNGSNNLNSVEFGKGYFIKLNNPDVIEY